MRMDSSHEENQISDLLHVCFIGGIVVLPIAIPIVNNQPWPPVFCTYNVLPGILFKQFKGEVIQSSTFMQTNNKIVRGLGALGAELSRVESNRFFTCTPTKIATTSIHPHTLSRDLVLHLLVNFVESLRLKFAGSSAKCAVLCRYSLYIE